MANEPETFMCLSSIAWSAISSIATAAAVIVALFLPFYYERKKKINLGKLIEDELRNNIEILKKANSMEEQVVGGNKISKINLICPMLIHLNLKIWNENKQTIAEISAKTFLKYSKIANFLEEIQKYAVEINDKKGQSPYFFLIETEIVKCLELYNSN